MSEFKRARVYALDKIGPINVGAGNTDYICKVFAQTDEGHDVVIQVTPHNFESYAKALLEGSSAEALCDPAKILSFKQNVQAASKAVTEAIATVQEKSKR